MISAPCIVWHNTIERGKRCVWVCKRKKENQRTALAKSATRFSGSTIMRWQSRGCKSGGMGGSQLICVYVYAMHVKQKSKQRHTLSVTYPGWMEHRMGWVGNIVGELNSTEYHRTKCMNLVRTGRRASTTRGPMVMLGTKRPSMTST